MPSTWTYMVSRYVPLKQTLSTENEVDNQNMHKMEESKCSNCSFVLDHKEFHTIG